MGDAWRMYDRTIGDGQIMRDVLDVIAPRPGEGEYETDNPPNGLGDDWESTYKRYVEGPMMQAMDLDGDGLANLKEFQWQLIPVNVSVPLTRAVDAALGEAGDVVFQNATDYDQDGWEDGPEVEYWNDPTNDDDLSGPVRAGQLVALYDPDRMDDFDGDGMWNVHDVDADNDGLIDGFSLRMPRTDDRYASWPALEPPQRPIVFTQVSEDIRVFHGEQTILTLPDSVDTDSDGLPDGEELEHWNELSPRAWRMDFDRDGLGSNLADPDADGDGLLDGAEAPCLDGATPGTSCMAAWDTDRDGLLDGDDLTLPVTDARADLFTRTNVAFVDNADGTRSFLSESSHGTDPARWDTDEDGLPDGWEVGYGLDPRSAGDGTGDPDRDGGALDTWTNADEYAYGKPDWWSEADDGAWWYGTMPDESDTDGDGVLDGDEVAQGTDPVGDAHSQRSSVFDPLAGTPLGNDELEYVDPQADAWLSAGIEDSSATAQATVDVPGLLADPEQFVEDAVTTLVPEPLAEPMLETWTTTTDTLDDARACAQPVALDAKRGSANASTIENAGTCVVGTVQSVAGSLLDTLESVPDRVPTAIEAVTEEPHARVAALAGAAEEFVSPVLQELPTRTLEPGRTDLGAATWPRPALTGASGGDDDVLAPLPYAQSPWPRFTAATLDALSVGELYPTVANVDGLTGEHVHLVATVDSLTYNVLVETDDGGSGVVPLVPVGVPYPVDLDLDAGTGVCADVPGDDVEVCGVDAVVTVTYEAAASATSLRFTVESVTGTRASARVSAFAQVPDTPHVLALGVDGRQAVTSDSGGLPGSVSLTVGTSVVEKALREILDELRPFAALAGVNVSTIPERDVFSVGITAAGGRPLKADASLWKVSTTSSGKSPVPGELAQAALTFPRAPSSMHMDLQILPREGSVSASWGSTTSTDPVIGASWASGGASGRLALRMLGLPTQGATTVTRGEDQVVVVHEALGVTPALEAAWDAAKPSDAGSRSLRTGGALSMREMPATLNVDVDERAKRLNFTSSSALGPTELVSWSRPDGTGDVCRGASGAHYVASRTEPTNLGAPTTCLTASLDGLRGATITVTDTTMEVNVTRVGGAGRLVVDVEGHYDLALDVQPWPASVAADIVMLPTYMEANVMLSTPIDHMRYGMVDGESRTEVSATDVPRALHAVADGARRVTFDADDRITDLAVLLERGTKASLGADDGVINLKTAGSIDALAVRLRDVSNAAFHADFGTGLTLTSDTRSTAPFHVRYREGTNWLNADLPRLPEDVRVTYNYSASAFDFRYSASEALPDLSGAFTVAEEKATVHVNVSDLPRSIRADATFGDVTEVKVAASDSIALAEVALLGIDREKKDLGAWVHYVDVDHVNTIDFDGRLLPQFHVKVVDLDDVSSTISADGVTLYSNASRSGQAGVRYVGHDGWIHAHASALPAWLRLDVADESLVWRAAPGAQLEADVSADLPRLIGNFSVRGAPDAFDLAWTESPDGLDARFSHDAASFPLVHADLLRGIGEQAAPSRFLVHGEEVPAFVNATLTKNEKHVRLTVADREGTPASANVLEVGYAADHRDFTNAITAFRDATGGVVSARLSDSAATEAFLRLPGISLVDARLEPAYPSQEIGVTYRADAPAPFQVDVDDGAGTLVRARADEMPAAFDATMLLVPDSRDFRFDYSGSSRVHDWEAEFTRDGRTLLLGGELPETLHASSTSDRLWVHASTPATLEASYAPTGQNVRVPDAVDYVIVEKAGQVGRFAARVSALESVYARESAGHYEIDHDARTDLYVSMANGTSSLEGWIRAPPRVLTLDVREDEGAFEWRGSDSAAEIDVQRSTATDLWRVHATTLPLGFRAHVDRVNGVAEVVADAPDAFGTLDLAYAGDGSRRLPVLDGDGLALDVTVPTDGGVPRERLAVRVPFVEALHARWSPSHVDLTMDRALASGAFTGRYRTPGAHADFTLSALPADLTVEAEGNVSALEDGVRVHANGHGAALGDFTLDYDGPGKEVVDLTARNLPDHVTLTARATGTEDAELRYDSGAVQAAGATTLDVYAFTKKKLTTNLTLTEVPQAFDLTRGDGDFSFTTSGGAVTGTLLFAPEGSRYRVPPFGWYGGSFSNESGQEHAFLRVNGLTKAVWSQESAAERQRIELGHSRYVSEAFQLSFVNSTATGNIVLSNVPDHLDLDLQMQEGDLRLDYVATDMIQRGSVVLRARDGSEWMDLVVYALPRSANFSVVGSLEEDLVVTWRHDERAPLKPTVFADVQAPDGFFFDGTLRELPYWVTARVTAGEASASQPVCVADVVTSGEIGHASFQLGSGARVSNGWITQGEHWFGYYDTQETPRVLVNLPRVQDTKFCRTPGDGFELHTQVGASPDLRVLVQDLSSMLKIQLEDVVAGEYSVTHTVADAGQSFQWNLPAWLDHVSVTWKRPPFGEDFVFGRSLETVTIDAWDVPPVFRFEAQDGTRQRVVLDTAGDEVGVLKLAGWVSKAKRGSGSGSSGSDISIEDPFELDAQAFAARETEIALSSHSEVHWPTDGSPHQIVARLGDRFELGLRVRGMKDVVLRISPDESSAAFRFQAGVDPGKALRAVFTFEDDEPPVHLHLPRAPAFFTSTGTMSEYKTRSRFSITPEEFVPEVTVTWGKRLDEGWSMRLHGVGADTAVSVAGLWGKAFAHSWTTYGGAGRIQGFTVGKYEDEAHFSVLRVGATSGGHIEGDLDGSLRHAEAPIFLDWRTRESSADFYFEHRVGDRSFILDGHGAFLLGSAAVGAWVVKEDVKTAAGNAWEWGAGYVTGAYENSKATLHATIEGIEYDVSEYLYRRATT